MVRECWMLSLLHRVAHVADVNCVPWSVVMVAGMPKCATHSARKVFQHMIISMLFNGHDSTHLMDLLMQVKRWIRSHGEAGRGPTRATCIWLNLFS